MFRKTFLLCLFIQASSAAASECSVGLDGTSSCQDVDQTALLQSRVQVGTAEGDGEQVSAANKEGESGEKDQDNSNEGDPDEGEEDVDEGEGEDEQDGGDGAPLALLDSQPFVLPLAVGVGKLVGKALLKAVAKKLIKAYGKKIARELGKALVERIYEEATGGWDPVAKALKMGECMKSSKCKSFDYHKTAKSCDLSLSAAGKNGVPGLYKTSTYDHYEFDRSKSKWTSKSKHALSGYNNGKIYGSVDDCKYYCLFYDCRAEAEEWSR